MTVYDAELTEKFGKATYQKGLDHYLQDKVKKLKAIPLLNTITAVVELRNQQFRVAIDKADMSSLCTCDNSGNCEHAVATLVAAEANNLINRTPTTPFAKWKNNVEQAQKKFNKKTAPLQNSFEGIIYNLQPNLQLETDFTQIQLSLEYSSKKVTEQDLEIISELNQNADLELKPLSSKILANDNCASALALMLESGKCYWQSTKSPALQYGAPQKLSFNWRLNQDKYKLELSLTKSERWFVIPTTPAWYIDPQKGTLGQIDSSIPGDLLVGLLNCPELEVKELNEFALWQNENLANNLIKLPTEKPIEIVKESLTPIFRIGVKEESYVAKLRLKYGKYEIPMSLLSKQYAQLEQDGKTIHLYRNQSQERKAFYLLDNYGFAHTKGVGSENDFIFYYNTEIGVRYDQFWLNIFEEVMPLLVSQGWQIEYETGVHPINVVDDPSFEYEISENRDWFKLGMQIDFDGNKVDLVPVLINWLKQTDNWRLQRGKVKIALNRHQFVRIHIDKLRPILDILQETNSKQAQFSPRQAHLLNEIPEINSCIGGQHVRNLAKQLESFNGIAQVEVPDTVNAELRPYQEHGLNWLNFLVEFNFGGILADDMGLGKTLQALCLLEVMRLNKQLDKPSLIICPTSLVGNWLNEASKFTPGLNIIAAYGSDRHKVLAELTEYDAVITTYPLVNRDFETFQQVDFKLMILDEAQNIKNPRAQMTQNIKKFISEYRLCLSGTPVENHLGELWSLFDFLMPGFLGTVTKFGKEYRKPIENLGDAEAQNRLYKKIKPFVLRRKKEEVAKELPKKTEIVKYITLEDEQRVLYETIRASMEDKVKNILQVKGLAQSQLECLDALLKLRQICCAPSLLNLESTKTIEASAKLEYLMQVIPEMIEEGRKILIFSQFAKMLELIAKRLNGRKIPYSKLTGGTRDRQAQIDSFQHGDNPVFLISLKAGGTGLNLTAADTVIHYDPWWNPAAEAQASDRAYRIGQTKPVFVYKLICQNTIEERVLKMQENKKSLNQNLFQKQTAESIKDLTAENLLELFHST
ncbi:SNF2-related protein [Catenovulum maritimum]|uniref:Helicase n=1 Tax=Catenovulum maritimum TaxID=1513271 RepID=A0A0J8GYM4_9ALTE|nr:SNF2-related protein [Catenovulum maritimum]KMT65833.1 hypothetical protein XM47_07505 [Catenovulum maritimum]